MPKHTRSFETVGYGPGYVIEDHAVQHLEGRLLTILESVGLPEKQEEALKGLIRNEVWELTRMGCYITGEQHTKVREENGHFGQSTPNTSAPR